MAENQALIELERLLDELFSGKASNDRVKEINQLLDAFSQQAESWRYCLFFLHNSHNHSVWMYSLNVMETFVTRLWPSMEASERDQVRQAMWQLLDLQSSNPFYIRNKTVKVIVAIARLEWPYSYPHFFQSIYQLIRQDSTTEFGLVFLLTASEELATPREDLLTSARRQELRTLLLKEVPAMLSILFGILNFHAEKHQQVLRSTPPPSPHISPAKPVTSAGEPLLPGQPVEDFRPVDTLAEEVCSMCLKCLAHIFSWIPLDQLLTLAMVDTLFYYSFYGCHSENDCTDCSGTLGHLAVGCISEILQRNCMPSQLQNFLMHVFEKTFLMLRRLTSDSAQLVSYAYLDDRFLAKCNEYLRVLMSLHLKRVESSPHFPVAEFLSLFQRHTMKQPQMDGFFLCLDAWSDFLDHLTMTHRQVQSGSSPPASTSQSRCKEPLLSLMDGLLRKVLMNFNLTELSDLDDERLDDDNETEWQQFVRITVEVFAKAAELYPVEAFKQLVPLFQSYSVTYYQLKQFVVRRGNDLHLELGGEDHERLYAVLRDLSTLLQMLGRLAEHFGGTHFLTRLDSAKSLFQGFCSVVRFSNEQELHSILMPLSDEEGPQSFEHIFIEVHAHALGALTAFCYNWLPQYYLSSLRQSARAEFRDAGPLVQSLCELAIPLMSRQIPERISVAAGQMLMTITHAVRPHHLTQIQAVQKFIVFGSKGEFNTLPPVTRQLSYRSVTNIFILPWPEVTESQQHWEGRAHEHSKFIAGAVHSFLELRKVQRLGEDQALIRRAHTHVTQALAVLSDLVSSVAGENSKSKAVLFTSVKSSVELAATLLSVYVAYPDVLSELMGFLLSVFQSLSAHIGKALTQSTMETVMQLLQRRDLQDLLSRGDKLSCDVMEKFLKILINQLSFPGGVGKHVLTSVLPFCLESIYPAVAELPVPDVKATFYELLTQILIFNWRFFFPANVLVHMEGESVGDHLENQEQFVAIMDIFIKSFMQPDMALFRQNLKALQELHQRHKLFSKPQFKEGMMSSFAHILLEVLVQKSHDLIREEVCLCLYTMASVDFPLFHAETLPSFIRKCTQLSEEQRSALASGYKMDKDLPSFVQNIHQFASDLRYFHLLNSALPQGTVKLVT